MTSYDVIGDIHGHAERLIGLLGKMGYVERNGAWRCQGRQAIFIGDLIDRGTQQLETIEIVRNMVNAGTAQIVLGNHEFNAIAYATPKEDGDFLRSHTPKNQKQHAAFLAAVDGDDARYDELIAWFMTIPMWLELDGLRAIHACWSEPDVEYVRPQLSSDNSLTDQLLVDASTEGHQAYASVETLVKGPEIRLPDCMTFVDKGGHRRRDVRVRWWDDSATTWQSLLSPGTAIFDWAGEPFDSLPDEPLSDEESRRYTHDVPVIFGHYWFEAPDIPTNPKALCVDYSAGAGKELVAYRFDGETELTADKLVSF
jgi:hypothetical protein